MRVVASLVMALLLAGAVFAQDHSPVRVSFYDGNPEDGAEEIVRVSVLEGSVSKRIHDIEDAHYLTVWLDGEGHTFEMFPGGDFKDDIYVNVNAVDLDDDKLDKIAARGDALTLAELIVQLRGG